MMKGSGSRLKFTKGLFLIGTGKNGRAHLQNTHLASFVCGQRLGKSEARGEDMAWGGQRTRSLKNPLSLLIM